MVRVLVDTNVLVSALIGRGKPKELVKLAAAGKLDLLISKEIVQEFLEITADPKIRRYVDRSDITNFLALISSVATFVQVRSRFRVVKGDPDDDKVVRAAYDGRASYIVSGDRHLLKIKKAKGIRIVTAGEILSLI